MLLSFVSLSLLSIVSRSVHASTVWSGNFNSYTSAASFDAWSWSTPVGEYQWYIHGSQATSHYLALDPSYKNPADTAETNGIKITIDGTALWNGQTMERTELIPQTSANLGTGQMYYHFSVMHSATNPPDYTIEHQIAFFESHFTELKIGVAPTTTNLQWMVSSVEKWGTAFTAGTWYNFAYDIDFSGNTVGLWASTGSSPLVKVVNNVAASTSTNSEDWHLGVLKLSEAAAAEDWYFSGVYIESGTITTSVGSGTSASGSASSLTAASTSHSTTSGTTSSTTTTTSTTTSAAPTGSAVPEYGQCGGTGYTGSTTCASGFTCKAISPPYYYQCL
ncbi:carbohydrate-binding module family 1 protein [Athelia psychrophila]|uniref:Carbohydrate-binding module family 1 protein n=1 Tax=Athelia psychrophila TaxID=1759441 RepID=A0A166UB14_9AGAM|nr:carbohydrate-binding module family 1 protein [Fibularhizoctonia sp. CBS 109695]